MRTKNKIIKESLNLFNENNFELSTTNLIARRSDILEGSLWYHFNTKLDIVSAHLDIFTDLYDFKKNHTVTDSHSVFIQGLFGTYEVIWDYRYLFRDSFEKIEQKNPTLFAKINKINKSIDQWLEESVIHARKLGILIINDSEIENILEISLIIGRYWFDFSKKRYSNESNEYLRKKGLNLLIKSFYPYLSRDSKDLINSIFKSV